MGAIVGINGIGMRPGACGACRSGSFILQIRLELAEQPDCLSQPQGAYRVGICVRRKQSKFDGME